MSFIQTRFIRALAIAGVVTAAACSDADVVSGPEAHVITNAEGGSS